MTLAVYPIGAEYAFPWYAVWALPLFAARRLTPVAWVVWMESIVLVAALKLPIAVTGSLAHSTLRVILTYVAPPALLVAFVVAAIRQYRWPRSAIRAAGGVVTVGTRRARRPAGGMSPPISSRSHLGCLTLLSMTTTYRPGRPPQTAPIVLLAEEVERSWAHDRARVRGLLGEMERHLSGRSASDPDAARMRRTIAHLLRTVDSRHALSVSGFAAETARYCRAVRRRAEVNDRLPD